MRQNNLKQQTFRWEIIENCCGDEYDGFLFVIIVQNKQMMNE
jgi:hypothetical protein